MPSERRKISDIIVKRAAKPKRPKKEAIILPAVLPRPRPHAFYWSLGTVLFFTFAVILLALFSYVAVKVTPRQEILEIDTVLRASASSPADLSLETLLFEEVLSRTGPVATLREIEERARGEVVIFNAFSSEPQLLIKNTRLQAPDGKIYRLSKEVLVPEAKVENGKIVPRGIEVEVVADRPGETYNLGLSDFTIPGFKGTARFDKFYARSQSEITGGFIGTVPVVSEADFEKLKKELERELPERLGAKIRSELPAGVFLPESAQEFTAKLEAIEPPPGARGERVTVRVKGATKGLALKEKELYKFLGKSYLGVNPPEEVRIVNFPELALEIINKNFEEKILTLRIKGRAHFVWEFEDENLIADLLAAGGGKRREVFSKYSAIARATIEFKPFFWRIFPDKPSRVRIERVLQD